MIVAISARKSTEQTGVSEVNGQRDAVKEG